MRPSFSITEHISNLHPPKTKIYLQIGKELINGDLTWDERFKKINKLDLQPSELPKDKTYLAGVVDCVKKLFEEEYMKGHARKCAAKNCKTKLERLL